MMDGMVDYIVCATNPKQRYRVIESRACQGCGNAFDVTSHSPGKKLCSTLCRNKYLSTMPRVSNGRLSQVKCIEKQCPVCEKQFFVTKYEAQQKTCSVKCSAVLKSLNPQRYCQRCEIALPPQNGVSKKTYCSRKCMGLAKRGEGSSLWVPVKTLACANCGKSYVTKERNGKKSPTCSLKCYRAFVNKYGVEGEFPIGTRRPEAHGYIQIKVANGEWIMEHRKVMEDHLGRKLSPKEVIHHINGRKKDNRVENLLLTTNREHKKMHHEAERIGLMVMSGELQVIGWRDPTKQGLGD